MTLHKYYSNYSCSFFFHEGSTATEGASSIIPKRKAVEATSSFPKKFFSFKKKVEIYLSIPLRTNKSTLAEMAPFVITHAAITKMRALDSRIKGQ